MFRSPLAKHVVRACILASTALVAAPVLAQSAAPAPALTSATGTSGPIKPFYGTIAPFYGTIAPFYGTIAPFYGTIAPFYGTIAPFYGTIAPFYGTIAPFYGTIAPFYGTIAPFYGTIAPFWGDINPFYGTIAPFWGDATSTITAQRPDRVTPTWSAIGNFWQTAGADWGKLETNWLNAIGTGDNLDTNALSPVATQLNAFVDQSATFWGAAVTARTGKSFRDGFANALFARYGIDPNDPASLGKMSAASRTSFMLDWYDGLMEYSGVDHVDHWMKTINWNPTLTQIQGAGKRTVIGLLDFAVTGDADVRNNIVAYDGVSNFTNGHGAAVASLMVAAQDGKGVMGIAPMASVVAYNPFDDTGTANWTDVTRGVARLASEGASIINMSLGVPGVTLDSGWKSVFSAPSVSPHLRNTVFVTAAGNDGKAQTQNISWDFNNDPALIVVGSVDPTGTISTFSNTPGNACLVGSSGKCDAANMLKNRFIVAPGELLLVSDDNGGVTRQTGTSFAAPLVSGTIALIQNRWPWLANYPKETVQIVLQSARDLGAPGVDEVYGVGLLDATAANSPLNFDNVQWYEVSSGGGVKSVNASKIADPKDQAKWEANGAFFYAFEKVGNTFRDFAVPLSSKLVGASILTSDGTFQRFQSYITSRMMDWAKGAGKFTATPGASVTPFASFTETAPVQNAYGLNLTMSVAPRNPTRRPLAGDLPFQSSLRAATPDNGFALRLGYGDGAVAFSGSSNLALFSDHDVDTGGVNPLLAMASGGGYAGAELALNSRLTVSAGVSANDSRRDLDLLSPMDRPARAAVDKYRTGAQHITVAYRINPAVTVNASLTRLDEHAGLLGLQSLDPADLPGTTTSKGMTVGADVQLAPTVRLSGSGTVGRTDSGDPARQNLAVGNGGLVTSAYEVALSADRLFDHADHLRVTLSQPMHLEQGKIDVTMVQVVDRDAGTLGSVTQSFELSGAPRRYVAELLYGHGLGKFGEMSLFGRANLRGETNSAPTTAYVVGSRYSLGF